MRLMLAQSLAWNQGGGMGRGGECTSCEVIYRVLAILAITLRCCRTTPS